MKRKSTFIILFLLFTMQLGAQKEKFPDNSLLFLKESLGGESTYNTEGWILSKELSPMVSKYDFSPILLERNDHIIGFIGTENYQRIKIKFLSIIKDPTNPSRYLVYGKSMVKSTICPFLGEINILCVEQEVYSVSDKESFYMEYGNGDIDGERYLAPEYFFMAEYTFYEDSKMRSTGKFEGVLKSNFYIYKDAVHYNDLSLSISDPFNNNQYAGVWTSYLTNKTKICNWGEFRIPQSGDLDYGAGEFSPNQDFFPYGWRSYSEQFNADDEEIKEKARKEENKKWW